MSRTADDDARGEAPRRPVRLRLILLSILALLLQLPFAIALSLAADIDPLARIIRIGVAAASPLVFALTQRWPGPRVAILAVLTLLDVLVWAGLAPGGEPEGRHGLGSAVDPGFDSGPDGVGPWRGPGGGPWGWDESFGGPETAPFHAAFCFALVAAIVRGRWAWAVASAGGLWLGALIIAPLVAVEWSVGRVVTATLGLAVTVGIGALLRHREQTRAAAAERAERRHAEAAQAERIRIARELHDVLGHSLSQINVQAGVGEHLIDRDPEQARRALAAIKELSSSGLDEVRAVLRTMRSAPLTPVRGLDDLPELIATMGGGPRIRLIDRRRDSDAGANGIGAGPDDNGGTGAPLSRAVDAAGYRIVQEALTNVVRHAEAETVTVEIATAGPFVEITVADDGRGMAATERGRGEAATDEGSGIPGMRERAEILGGTFSMTGGSHGGTTVTVRLPRSGSGSPDTPGASRA
ncbi:MULTISPECIES: sensor histidine kinase [Brevibacterium]|nr:MULTISPECIES: sensor histidine kinase [Brevibacterium]